MANGKVSNRWLVVLGALLIQLALGAIYAWSLFTSALRTDPYNFTAAQTQGIFSAGLFTFALVMIFAGLQMKTWGPRKLAAAGGIVLGSAYILGSFFGSNFIGQLVTIGILGGAGIGLAYVVPIAVGMKWFPDKKGLISGIAVAGFGFGATIWVKVGGSWFGLVAQYGVQSVFLFYGIAFLIMVVLGSKWMVNPPEGYVPEGYTPPAPKTGSDGKHILVDCVWQDMLSRVGFWTIWVIFVFSGMAGLMVIGTISIFGIDTLQAKGLTAGAAAAAAGTAMAWYAILNGLGRIAWGKMSDIIGAKMAIFLMTFLQGILMLTIFYVATTPLLLTLYACAIGFNFGGNFALFPVSCAELFGTKNIGSNYPFVFTAYGIGGIIGPMLGGFVRDTTGNLLLAFIPAGIACLLGAALALTIRRPV